MRKPLLFDLLVYGGMSVLSIILAVVSACTAQDWNTGKVVVLILVPLAFTGVAVAVVLGRVLPAPNYTTSHGVFVWHDNVDALKDPVIMELALTYFADHFGVRDLVLKMYHGMKIEWKKDPISACGIGWSVKDKNGLQQGNGIMVRWLGSIHASALFHELIHAYMEECTKMDVDYQHSYKPFWNQEQGLNSGFDR